MQPHQQLVVDEKTALDEKLAKLTAFVTTLNPVFAKLPTLEQERLIQQRELMRQYSALLGERIAAFPTEDA
jgi:hypothetical protein